MMPQATPAPTTGTCARAGKREAEAHAHARVNLRPHAHTPWCHTSPPAPLPVAYTLGPRHSPARHSTPPCSAASDRAGVKLLSPLQGSVVPNQEHSAQQQDSHKHTARTQITRKDAAGTHASQAQAYHDGVHPRRYFDALYSRLSNSFSALPPACLQAGSAATGHERGCIHLHCRLSSRDDRTAGRQARARLRPRRRRVHPRGAWAE
jgi:hypothetical protein